MTGRSFHVVHNIPSPYRLHLFRVLSQLLSIRGYSFHVDFLARGHSDRPHWAVVNDLGFSHTFWPDIGPRFRGKKWHTNPGLLARHMADPPTVLMIGGPWDSVTGFAATFAPMNGTIRIGWFEGNTKTPGRTGALSRRVKGAILNHQDWLAVPGQEGRLLAQLLLGARNHARIALLPNLVDEIRFREPITASERERVRKLLRVGEKRKLAIMPARLIPVKGIVEFLALLSPRDLGEFDVVILGDGPLLADVEAIIRKRGLTPFVRIHPSVSYDGMPSVYRSADLFVLSSLEDRNPLSVVEALHAGLPILVSDRIGNLAEALPEGENGFSFRPGSPEALFEIRRAFDCSSEVLHRLGTASQMIAMANWSSNKSVSGFLDAVLPT